MANRTRNIVLRVPVTAEERAMIERKMQQMGTGCFSVYARKMLIDGYVIRLDYSDVKAMTAELQKIGTNINQIAKRVNATGTLYAQDIEDIKGAMAEIWQLQRSILSKAPYDNVISCVCIASCCAGAFLYFETNCPEVRGGSPGCRSPPSPVSVTHPPNTETEVYL